MSDTLKQKERELRDLEKQLKNLEKQLANLGLCDDVELVDKPSENLIFNMSDEDFAEFKSCFEHI